MEKPKGLKCTLKVLENRSTFEMYLSTSTSTEDFPEMYLSTFQVLYKLYLSTDVLKYKVLLPGSGSSRQGHCGYSWWSHSQCILHLPCRVSMLHCFVLNHHRKPCARTYICAKPVSTQSGY